MSRRSVTTIHARVTLRVPQGCTIEEVLGYIRTALSEYKSGHIERAGEMVLRYPLNTPLASLDINSLLVKLEKKETIYP